MHLLHSMSTVYYMIIYENKADLLARKILVHVARDGVYELASFSKLAKSIKIGRSLLYFYYKNEREIIQSLHDLFIYELDYHHHYIKQRQFDLDQCLTHLVDMKDLYFFIIACVKAQDRRKDLQPFVEYTLKTLNTYVFEQFIQKYSLHNLSAQRREYMYDCLRSLWLERSGVHEDWCYEKVQQLSVDMDQFLHGLREDLASET